MLKHIFFASFAALALSGCMGTSKYMIDSSEEEFQKLKTDNKAQLILMRVTSFGGAIAAPVIEITDSGKKMVGISTANTKMSTSMEPGKHTFMVVGEAADFMEIDAAPGKTYYALVEPRMGVWKARFTLQPIKKEGACKPAAAYSAAQINTWLKETAYVVKQDSANTYLTENMADIDSKQAEYWPVWSSKTDRGCYVAASTDAD